MNLKKSKICPYILQKVSQISWNTIILEHFYKNLRLFRSFSVLTVQLKSR